MQTKKPAPKPKPKAPLAVVHSVPANQQVTRVRAFCGGKTILAAGFHGEVLRWDIHDSQLHPKPATPGHQGWCTAIEAVSDASAVSVDSWGNAILWNVAADQTTKAKEFKQLHNGWVVAVAAHPNGKMLATAARTREVTVRTLTDDKPLQQWKLEHIPMSVQFSPTEQTLWVGDDFGKLHEYSLINGKLLRTLDASVLYLKHRLQDVGGVRTIVFSHDQKSVLVSGTQPKTGGFVQGMPTLVQFDLSTGKEIWQFQLPKDSLGYFHDLFVVRDTIFLAYSGQPGNGGVCIVKSGQKDPLFDFRLPNCHSICRIENENRLVAASTNANSSGNGRPKGDEYPENHSPISLLEWMIPEVG
ncbi:MAG: hypothetical protein R3B84_17970 [Zavarzinella sp.]